MRKEAVIPKTSELHAYERPTLYQKIWVSENLAPQIETDARGGATQESLAAPRTARDLTKRSPRGKASTQGA